MMKWIVALTLVLLSGCAGVDVPKHVAPLDDTARMREERMQRRRERLAMQTSIPPSAPVPAPKETTIMESLNLPSPVWETEKKLAKEASQHSVKHHRVIYRHYQARVLEVDVVFSPPIKQKGQILYSLGSLPQSSAIIKQAEREICGVVESTDLQHDAIKFPLTIQVFRLEDEGPMVVKKVPVSTWHISTCAPDVSAK